ncbi:hypothetical protein MRX96_040007 [Rhipicephalus microplus]
MQKLKFSEVLRLAHATTLPLCPPLRTAAVLWRTLVVQSIRRQYVWLFVELVFVVVLATLSLSKSNTGSRSLRAPSFSAVTTLGQQLSGFSGDYRKTGDSVDDSEHDTVLYSPKSDYAGRLMNAAFPKDGMLRDLNHTCQRNNLDEKRREQHKCLRPHFSRR